MRTSLPLTEIWPISDRFIEQKYYIASLCITVQYALLKIVSDKLSKLDSKLSDIWNYFRTMSDGRRQTESLEMDTASFELFRAACTTFYSRLPPEQGSCEINKSEDKNRKAVVQQTYKVRCEVGHDQSQGYTINLYTTCIRILINGKKIDLFMDKHLPAIHELMMKPIYAGTVTGVRGLNDILRSQMQSLLDQRYTGAIPDNQLLPRREEVKVEVTTPGSPPSSEPPKCSVCRRVLRSRGALCEKAQHWIHYRCDKLIPDEIDRLHTDEGFIYNCKPCSVEETEVKRPVESKTNSTESTILKLPSIRHDNCSQVEEILTKERVDDDILTCLTCQKSILGKAIACLQCNMNCHKDCIVALGIDFICLSCKALESQINTREVSPSQNVGNIIQS